MSDEYFWNRVDGYHFKLQNKIAVPCSFREWATNKEQRRVAQTSIGILWISTVFLGLDHSFGDGPPMLFETMIFHAGDGCEYQTRCETYAEAEEMHQLAVAAAKEMILPGEQMLAELGKLLDAHSAAVAARKSKENG